MTVHGYNSKLKEVKLYKDADRLNSYCLSVTYEKENSTTISEFTIPKIILPINNYPNIKQEHFDYDGVSACYINFGFGDLLVARDRDNNLFYERVIENKTQKMTLKEIEEKLGHKIELISE